MYSSSVSAAQLGLHESVRSMMPTYRLHAADPTPRINIRIASQLMSEKTFIQNVSFASTLQPYAAFNACRIQDILPEEQMSCAYSMKWNLHAKRVRTCAYDPCCTSDFRVELDNMYDLKTDNLGLAQVHNLVGTCRIVSTMPSFNLLAVSNLLPNSSFEKQKFAAITIRLGEPTCTVLLFTSGKMVLTGCKSLLDCILASRIVTNLLIDGFPGIVFKLDVVKIQNIVGNALLPLEQDESLDLDAFYSDFNVFCTYQPTMFPGLIYRPVNLPVVFLVFFSGKVVITGAKNLLDVYDSWKTFRTVLHKYKKKKLTSKSNRPEASTVQTERMHAEIPVALKHHVRMINILDRDINVVNKKLQDRTVSNILSYLQLMLLKLDQRSTRSTKMLEKISKHDSLMEYTSFLSDSASSSHD